MRRRSSFASLNKRIAMKLESRGAKSISGLARQYRAMSSFDGNQGVSKEQFKLGVLQLCGDDYLTTEDVEMLFSAYDRNCEGIIRFDEFLRGVKGDLNSRRMRMVNRCFNTLDKDGKGIVTLEDIKRAYNTKSHPEVINGSRSEESVMEQFLGVFESDANDGKVYKEEWTDYYGDVSSAIMNDNAFIAHCEAAWSVTEFDDLVNGPIVALSPEGKEEKKE